MQYLYLVIVILMCSAQNVTNKQYGIKAKKTNNFLFAAIVAFTAMIFFIASSGFRLEFNKEILPYSIAFAIAYASALVSQFLAIKWGPLSITLLVISYSLILPAMYGLIALGDTLGILAIIGLVLLVISLLLISNVLERKKEKDTAEKEKQFSLKWFIALIIGFVGNGMCSIIQKMQNVAFFDEASSSSLYKNEFMIIALAIAVVVLLIVSIINKEDIRVGTLPCVGFAALTGIANGIVNLLVMVLSAPGVMNASILFPSISGGGIVLGFLLSIFVYKEKLTTIQYIGYAIGTVSDVLLNI